MGPKRKSGQGKPEVPLKARSAWGLQVVEGIYEDTLEMIMASARDTHPYEFSAMLRVEEGVISEILPLPGTISGPTSAQMMLHMLHIDLNIVGGVHSHPSGVCLPSGADLHFFEKFGYVHMIVGRPYRLDSWNAFNSRGEIIRLEIFGREKEEDKRLRL